MAQTKDPRATPGPINRAFDVELPGHTVLVVTRIPQDKITAGTVMFRHPSKDDPYGEAWVRNLYVNKWAFRGVLAQPDDASKVLVIVALPNELVPGTRESQAKIAAEQEGAEK